MIVFFGNFLYLFIVLIILLLIIKTVLIAYRISTRQWPASIKYLVSIIEVDQEILKIGAIALVALILSAAKYFFQML